VTVINTNVQSLIAKNALTINNRSMAKVMNQLSTGYRINSAGDDAAGLAVSQNMTAQIRSLNQAVRNANDGVSIAQTAEGAMIEVSNMLQRMRELAVQATSGQLSDTQRGYLNNEFTALRSQIDTTITNTKWNQQSVLGSAAAVTFSIQVGMNSGDTVNVVTNSLSTTTYSAAAISSTASAAAALALVDSGIESVTSARATLGAAISRLNSAADNLTNVAQNTSESRSRILDTDYATATTELARTQIIQQAGTAVLAQANQIQSSVLALLKG